MLSILLLSVAWAQNPFRVEVQPVHMKMDQTESVKVLFVVPDGYHLYQDMLSVVPTATDGLKFEEAKFPLGHLIPDPANPAQMREVFDETVEIVVPVSATKQGVYTSEFTVRFQGCKATLCYMPKTDVVSGTIVVDAKDSKGKP